MLEIGFILPPSTNAKPFRQVPLTSLYLLTVIRELYGNKVGVGEIDLRGIQEENIKFYIPEKDVYFYTVMSPEWEDIKEVHKLIKSCYPKAKHVAGGVHVYLFQEECLQVFDAISIGEGEYTVVQIIDDLLANRELRTKYVCESPDLVDQNAYPYPDRGLLPKTAIVQTGLLVGENAKLLTTDALFSRWCPFRCAFCVNITFGKTRFRSPEWMDKEIDYLKREYDIKALVIKDDNAIPPQKKITFPYLEAIAKHNLKWRGQSRANGITEDMVKLAAESGCTDIAIGVESPNQKVLDIINKHEDINKTKEYIKLLKKYNIGVRLLLIMGLPGETETIKKEFIDFVDETQPTSLVLALFSPYPGSDMATNPDKYGIHLLKHEYKQLRNYFGRLDPNERPQMFYEYKEATPWGNPLSNEQILQNYWELQNVFREKGLNF